MTMRTVRTELRPRRTRTKTGCFSCRGRRKKCDGQKPRCKGCLRNQLNCVWPDTEGSKELMRQGMEIGTSSDASPSISFPAGWFPEHEPSDLFTVPLQELSRDVQMWNTIFDLPASSCDSSTRTGGFFDVGPPQGRLRIDFPSNQLDRWARGLERKCLMSNLSSNPVPHLESFELVQHYHILTKASLKSMAPYTFDSIWSHVVPEAAQAYPYLMYAIHATAAMHRARLHPHEAPRYAALSSTYRKRALASFQTDVSRIDRRNAVAVLCFSFFQVVLGFATPFILPDASPTDPINAFLEIMSILRGYLNLQPDAFEHITEGPLYYWSRFAIPEKASPPEQLLQLVQKLSRKNEITPSSSADEKPICRLAISLLQKSVSDMTFIPMTWSTIWAWPLSCADNFLELVRKRHPVALLTIGHWALVLAHASDRWFFRDWDSQIILYLRRMLGPEWQANVERIAAELERIHSTRVPRLPFAYDILQPQSRTSSPPNDAGRIEPAIEELDDDTIIPNNPQSCHPLVEEYFHEGLLRREVPLHSKCLTDLPMSLSQFEDV